MGKSLNRCVIIGSAPFTDAALLKRYIRADDYIIAADGGQRLSNAMGVSYDLLVGDFDSSLSPLSDAEKTVRLPTHKDDTDVLAAMRIALEHGHRRFVLLGCLGGRLDHTIANIFLLKFLHHHGAGGVLVDECHEVSLLPPGCHVIENRPDRVLSLLPYGGDADGVCIDGAMYPLSDATLDTAMPLGVSNEFFGKSVSISLKNGFLLMILAKKDGNAFTDPSL